MKIATMVTLLGLFALLALADEDAARFFTGRGREALTAGDTKEAAKQFRKALEEAPGHLPAMLGLGETSKEMGKKEEAIRFLESVLDLSAGRKLSEEEQQAVDRAEELMKKLDRPRLVFRQVLSKYLADILDLARRSEKEDPELARRCADRVLRLDPQQKEAKEIIARLGSPGVAEVASGEVLLFNGKNIADWQGAEAPWWTLSGGVLVADVQGGQRSVSHKDPLKGNYALSCELRFTRTYRNPSVGLRVAYRGLHNFISFSVFDISFALDRYPGKNELTRLCTAAHYEFSNKYSLEEWNTYELLVEGRKITASVNGKKIFDWEAEEDGVFDGHPSLGVQNGRVEVRHITVRR